MSPGPLLLLPLPQETKREKTGLSLNRPEICILYFCTIDIDWSKNSRRIKDIGIKIEQIVSVHEKKRLRIRADNFQIVQCIVILWSQSPILLHAAKEKKRH